MEVLRRSQNRHPDLFEFTLRKGKKRIVIRFELNAASFLQDTPVAVQKSSVGQSRGAWLPFGQGSEKFR